MVPTTLAVDFVVSQTRNSVCNEMLIMQFEASVLSLSREVKCYMIPFFVLILLVAYFYVLFIQRIQLKTVSNFGNI